MRVALSNDAGFLWCELPLRSSLRNWTFKSWLKYDLFFFKYGMPTWPPEGVDEVIAIADGFQIRFRDEWVPFESSAYLPWAEAEWLAAFDLKSRKWWMEKVRPLDDGNKDPFPNYVPTVTDLLPPCLRKAR